MKSRAVVLVADRQLELKEIEVPDLPPGFDPDAIITPAYASGGADDGTMAPSTARKGASGKVAAGAGRVPVAVPSSRPAAPPIPAARTAKAAQTARIRWRTEGRSEDRIPGVMGIRSHQAKHDRVAMNGVRTRGIPTRNTEKVFPPKFPSPRPPPRGTVRAATPPP